MELNEKFNPIRLEDKEIIQKILHQAQYPNSEYTFTNFYMWRNYYNFRWAEIDDIFFLAHLNSEGNIIWFPPICKTRDQWNIAIDLIKEWSKKHKKPVEIHRVPEIVISQLKKELPNFESEFIISPDRNNWDYLYRKEDLTNLPGKTYANFRKTMNKFKSSYKWRYEEITPEIHNEILDLQAEWCDFHACADDTSLSQEDQAIYDLLKHWDYFDLIGGVLWMDEKIAAFTIAEQNLNNSVVVHVEKADVSYRGIYENLVNQFCSTLPDNIEFINREQDLGKENLRNGKMRYHPCGFVEKFLISLKNK